MIGFKKNRSCFQLVNSLRGRYGTKEDNNDCYVVFAATFCGLRGQSLGAHPRLFNSVPDDGDHLIVAYNIPKSITSHDLTEPKVY